MTRGYGLRWVAAAAVMSAATPAAWAQVGPGGIAGHGAHGSEEAEPKKAAPPPAIPGAQSNPDTVVPASKTAKDLDPNAALFDAIDRGDLTAAREALSRGADLDARNVLGQRPIDMSVDLSRNAITFLLLSMRSEAGDPEAQAAAGQADEAAPAPTPAATRGRRHRPAAPEVLATAQRASSHEETAPMQPSAGFLGFGH